MPVAGRTAEPATGRGGGTVATQGAEPVRGQRAWPPRPRRCR